MMSHSIAIIEGDGIGPEITAASVSVLKAVSVRFGLDFELIDAPAGAASYKKTGHALPADSLSACKAADAILKAPVGSPDVPPGLVEREVVLGLRQDLDLYANVRPVKLFSCLKDQSCLRADKVQNGVDWLFVRENSEGLYSRNGTKTQEGATDVSVYSHQGVERILRYAFEEAQKRKRHVTSVDKANVLYTSQFWRETATSMGKTEFSSGLLAVTLRHEYVDAMTQYLMRTPDAFDVIVTDNLFGDILTDQASEIVGSLGLGSGANLNPATGKAMFEPLHGSAPALAGTDRANPLGMVLSVGMMLEFLGEREAASGIQAAVQTVLKNGARTQDIAGPNDAAVGTKRIAAEIAKAI